MSNFLFAYNRLFVTCPIIINKSLVFSYKKIISVHRMSTNARKRLMRDFKRIQNEPPEGIQAAPLGKQ